MSRVVAFGEWERVVSSGKDWKHTVASFRNDTGWSSDAVL